MFGYDWPRLHAALNDLPAALLLVAVMFDILAAVTKRASFRTVGFWTTITRNEAPVASPPTIANSGHSTPPATKFGRAR